MSALYRQIAALPPAQRAGLLIVGALLPAALIQNLLLMETTRGHFFDFHLTQTLVEEATSIGVIAALVPALGWWAMRLSQPTIGWGRWFAGHLAGLLAFSPLHVTAMAALRYGIFGLIGRTYHYGLEPWCLATEFGKDALTYGLLLLVFAIVARREAAPRTAGPAPATALWVKTRDGRRRVELAQIRRVAAAGNYVTLVLADAALLHRATMAEMQQLLPADRFHRVHRSHIVNRDTVRVIEGSGDRDLVLADGSRVPLGRRDAASVEARMLG